MGQFEEQLKEQYKELEKQAIEQSIEQSRALQIKGEDKTKEEYIVNADEGLIVAFRLDFESKSGVPLTKVISGKILENNTEEEIYTVETRNGLRYVVPYQAVVWVKTGVRWPRGVYEDMKKGSVRRDTNEEFGELEEVNLEDEEESHGTDKDVSDEIEFEM